MQTRVESWIHEKALRHTMLRAHRQAWSWQVSLKVLFFKLSFFFRMSGLD